MTGMLPVVAGSAVEGSAFAGADIPVRASVPMTPPAILRGAPSWGSALRVAGGVYAGSEGT